MCHLILGIPLFGLGLFALVPFQTALPSYLALFAVSALLWWKVAQAMHRPVQSGREALWGKQVTVENWHGRRGQVRYRSELWNARTPDFRVLQAGDPLTVVDLDGLTLCVRSDDSVGQRDPS